MALQQVADNVSNRFPRFATATSMPRTGMRIFTTICLFAATLCTSHRSGAQAGNGDEQVIRTIVGDFAKSWNTPGMPRFEDLFTQDADFVVISGKWFKGRDAIVSYHKGLLANFYKGSRLSPENVLVRFLSPTVAVAHVDWKSSYTENGKQEEQTALMTLMLTKADGTWKIAAAHNTLTGGPRYAFRHAPQTTSK